MNTIVGAFHVRLLTSLGLVVGACGPDDKTSGATDGATSGDAATEGASGSSSSGAPTTSGGSGGASESSGSTAGEVVCKDAPPDLIVDDHCFLIPAGLPDCAACDAVCQETELQNVLRSFLDPPECTYTLVVLCPTHSITPDETCCYTVAHSAESNCGSSGGTPGRPFFVEGRPRLAAPVTRQDWSESERPAVSDLSEETRAVLAALWAADAAMEHASIASFARFALQLLALGAPAELVAGAAQAMADEIAHARACYALAGAYAGRPIGPGPLSMSGAVVETDLIATMAATIAEGCVGETLAALLAEAAAQTASDPAVRATLRQIAEDEGRHAELAWRFVQWALVHSPAARVAALDAFAAALHAPIEVSMSLTGTDAATMRAHGRLTPTEQVALRREALIRVVTPAAEALLEAPLRSSVAA